LAFALKLLGALGVAALFAPETVRAAAGDLYGTLYGSFGSPSFGTSVQTVERFRPDGTSTTFATDLPSTGGIAFDRAGNLFVSLSSRGEIVKITLSGTRTTFASGLDRPGSIAFDAAGFLFVIEAGAKQIVKFAPDGTKSTFATELTSPSDLAFDLSGNLFANELFGDANAFFGNSISVVVKFSKAGEKSTFATTTGVNTPAQSIRLRRREVALRSRPD
jgi:hypothetical protein